MFIDNLVPDIPDMGRLHHRVFCNAVEPSVGRWAVHDGNVAGYADDCARQG